MKKLWLLCIASLLFLVIRNARGISSSGNIIWKSNCRCKCECKNGDMTLKSDCPCEECKCKKGSLQITIGILKKLKSSIKALQKRR